MTTTNALKCSDLTLTKTGCVSLKHLKKEKKESYEYAIEKLLEFGDWRGTILEGKQYAFELSAEARCAAEEYIHLDKEGYFYCESY